MSFAFGTIERRDAGVRQHHDPVRKRRRSSLSMRDYFSKAHEVAKSRSRQINRAYAHVDLETAEALTFGVVLEEPTDGPVFEGPTLEEINAAADNDGYWPFVDYVPDFYDDRSSMEEHDSARCLTCLEVIGDYGSIEL